jgi:hypothetical protein
MKGKIYKLTCEDLVYFGSTTKKYICERLANHKYSWKNKKGLYTSELLFERGEVIINLVEENDFENREELLKRERFYIENNECVNRCIPGRTQREYQNLYYNKTDKRKNYINNRNKKKITCNICNKEMNFSSLKRHKQNKHL